MSDPNWPVWLYVAAWLLPLASFVFLVLGGKHWGKAGGYVACAAIIGGFVLSAYGLYLFSKEAPAAFAAVEHDQPGTAGGHGPGHESGHEKAGPAHWHYNFTWITIGARQIGMGFWVDNLTVIMFFMVTMVASLIHIYSIGYMGEELEESVHDHQALGPDQPPLHRRGRFPRFFTYMSLFCFSMLGLVIADNVFMVFMFWELVGLCSYLLIGFYYERKSASNAANKAFITNRVGDAGMIIGMMIIWTTLGTFNFEAIAAKHPGEPGSPLTGALWTIAGIAIFAGCVGKSAQFPLHVWLPDAMEGPTPVSALIHAATMVAAGVYLVGRFYFLFSPTALLVIAYTGGITLFMAGTIALVMTDIKRVLAYSTVSQLGYMMLGLGVGGWAAGLFHLLTHAYFKALLFLCSGAVIYGCHHEQDMTKMGGLFKKMPITALTMLVGVLAICGIPLFSGYYSKDAIVAHALLFWQGGGAHGEAHPQHVLLFVLPTVGAGITAFYMFRLFFMTFTGEPRDEHVHEKAHESPAVMWLPLAVLAVASVIVGYSLTARFWGGTPLLESVLSYGPPHKELAQVPHELHQQAGLIALAVVGFGIVLSGLFYWLRALNAEDIRRQFPRLHDFLLHKWYFDELYAAVLVRPALAVAEFCRGFDWNVLDRAIDGLAEGTLRLSFLDGWFDFRVIDGIVNWISDWVYAWGVGLRRTQTGQLRQYVMFLAVAAVGLLMVIQFLGHLGPNIFPNFFPKSAVK